MLPRYQANVRTLLPDGCEMWDFVSSRHLFKTLKAAQDACEQHFKLWSKAAEASGIRKLEELFGKVPFGYPLWVRPKLGRNVFTLLNDIAPRKRRDICELNPDDLSKTSDSFVGSTDAKPEIPIPVLPVVEPEPSIPSPAESAEKQEKEPNRRVSRSTAKSAKTTAKRKKSTKRSAKSEGKPSANSPKKKSKRSES